MTVTVPPLSVPLCANPITISSCIPSLAGRRHPIVLIVLVHLNTLEYISLPKNVLARSPSVTYSRRVQASRHSPMPVSRAAIGPPLRPSASLRVRLPSLAVMPLEATLRTIVINDIMYMVSRYAKAGPNRFVLVAYLQECLMISYT
jgi:hypothetical protein